MVPKSGIRILLVEDDAMARAGLELFVEAYPDFQLLGKVTSGEEALEFCERAEPDVIVMDIKLPGLDGVDTTALIRRARPQIQVVALSSFDDQAQIERAFRAGVVRYVSKTSPARDLVAAIRAAYVPRQPQP